MRGNFGNIAWEDIFCAVEVVTEIEIIYFGSRAKVTVLANDQVEDFLGWGHQSEALEYSKELLRSYVKRLAAVKVLETGFK